MKKKTLDDLSELRMVFSTDPSSVPPQEEEPTQDDLTPYAKQSIRISRDKKHRGGKEVTLLAGFELNESGLEAMAKMLKTSCGVGGSVVEGLVLLQGDQRKKLPEEKKKMGFKKIKVIQ